MSTKSAKPYLLIGMVIAVLCCGFGCVSILNNYNQSHPSEQPPTRTLSIEIPENQREVLFAQLQKFSDKNGLDFHLSFYKNKEVFFVVMYGKNFHISALSKPVNTRALDIHFYEEDPTNPPAKATVDELFDDLEAFISEIPDVRIIKER